jgi:hypothetical protein
MSNQYTHYASTDASAPVLNFNSVGSLIGVLNACLVNGYGTQVAAGWTSPFTSTNIAVYRAPSGVQHYWQVNDNIGAIATMWGFETMSGFNTGTGQFPSGATNNQTSKGSSATNEWHVFADSRTVIVILGKAFSVATGYGAFYFGEIFSFLGSDAYRTLLKCSNNGVNYDKFPALSNSIETASANAYMPRGYTGVGTAINVACTGDAAKSNSSALMNGVIPFPDPVNGGLYLSPIWISDPTTAPIYNIRGQMRGIWHFLHPNTSLNNLQVYNGTGTLAGKTFMAFTPAADNTQIAALIIETSATLPTN